MSITLYEKQENNFYLAIRQEKQSPLYIAMIAYRGKTVYKNYFETIRNAKKALIRNYKKFK